MYEDFIQNRVSQLRMQKGVSAREMSLSIGQNESYINRIENKNTLPSMQSFLFICEYLGVTPKEFFDVENANPQLISQLIEKLKKLDEKTLNHIYQIVNDLLA